MLGTINNLKALTSLTSTLPDNTYVLSTITVKQNIATFNVNTGYKDKHLPKLLEVFNNKPQSKMIISVRGEKEHFTDGAYPNTYQLNKLIEGIDKVCKVFYQEPWPAIVPNFNTEDTVVLRFGYDEGSSFDKACANKTNFDIKNKNGSAILLISKDDNVVVENKVPVLI